MARISANRMEYFFAEGQVQKGPFPLEQLRAQGLRPELLVWRDGMADWVRADHLPELAALFVAPPVKVAVSQTPPITPTFAPAASLPFQVPTSLLAPVNPLAIASLVLGIASIPLLLCHLLGVFPGISAIALGLVARGQIRRGQGRGSGVALAGILCAVIPIVLLILGFLLLVVVFIIKDPSGRGHHP